MLIYDNICKSIDNAKHNILMDSNIFKNKEIKGISLDKIYDGISYSSSFSETSNGQGFFEFDLLTESIKEIEYTYIGEITSDNGFKLLDQENEYSLTGNPFSHF